MNIDNSHDGFFNECFKKVSFQNDKCDGLSCEYFRIYYGQFKCDLFQVPLSYEKSRCEACKRYFS